MPPDYLQIQARPTPIIYERFQPSDIPDLGLDLDTSYGVLTSIGPDTPAGNGDPVRRWLDKSGNGRHFDQSTAINQPQYDISGLNGCPSVNFDGVNDALFAIAGLDLIRDVSGSSIFIVTHPDSPTSMGAEFPIYIQTGGGGRIRAGFSRRPDNTIEAVGRRLDSDPSSEEVSGPNTGEAVIYSALFDYSSALLSFYGDGGLIGVDDPFQTPGNTSDTDSSNIVLGNAPSFTTPYPGKIARVLVWPRALTAPELAAVHSYLSQTYGIPLA